MTDLPPEEPILFDEIRERLSLAAIEPASGLYSRLKYWYGVAPYGADIDDR